jgi:predicted transposase YbfD/YdcC
MINIEKLKENAGKIKDPRRTNKGHNLHKLTEMVIIALCSRICMGKDYEEMEEFGKEREKWLKEELGLELINGIPDSDTFERLFERLNPQELNKCLIESIEFERAKRGIASIDGKTICGSENEDHDAYHVISVFVAENQLTLGQITAENKKSEIKMIPKVLDLVDVTGDIVTIDAAGCYKPTVEKIVKKEADYVIGLKKNQPKLYEAVEEHFMFHVSNYGTVYTEEKNGGRLEKREYLLETDLDWLDMSGEWSGLKSVGMVKSVVERKGEPTFEIRFFISSLSDVDEFAYAVRKHWSIENNLHWSLDVVFREDDSRVKKGNAPLNLNVLNKISLSLLKNANISKNVSLSRRMYKAALNSDILDIILLDSNRAKY